MASTGDDPGTELLDDDELLARFCGGQTAAFDLLFNRHYQAVYNFARMMLSHDQAAEEVLQETFVAVARHACSYAGRGRFKGWLMRIVRNRCLNQLAHRPHNAAPDALAAVAAQGPSPLQQAASNEQCSRLMAAMGSLPERQREALTLYAFEQMSYAQIAQVLDMPLNTVKTLIHRARAHLAAALCNGETL